MADCKACGAWFGTATPQCPTCEKALKRLTKPLCGGYELPMIPMEIKTQYDLQKYHEARRFYESCAIRCGQYEDTGMEPEEIISAVDMAKIACALHELNAYKELGPIDRLRELVQADQAGRLVVLPCKVGNTVWYITPSTEICEAEVIGIWLNVYTNPQMWLEIKYHSKFTGEGEHKSRIDLMLGKTVFLTREEAEAALKGEDHETDPV